MASTSLRAYLQDMRESSQSGRTVTRANVNLATMSTRPPRSDNYFVKTSQCLVGRLGAGLATLMTMAFRSRDVILNGSIQYCEPEI